MSKRRKRRYGYFYRMAVLSHNAVASVVVVVTNVFYFNAGYFAGRGYFSAGYF